MRAKSGVARHRRNRKILRKARGMVGGRSRFLRTAKESVRRAGQYAYVGRRRRKRDFRSLWITRITAAVRARGYSYARFMNGLKKAAIGLNRKMLSEIAIHDPAAFDRLVDVARQHAPAKAKATA
jgi:large subunit ribosomal protein L20